MLQIVAVFAAILAVGRRGRLANTVMAFAVLCCGWQLVGVRGATLINTTMAPYLGPLAGVVLLSAWVLGRAALKAEEADAGRHRGLRRGAGELSGDRRDAPFS